MAELRKDPITGRWIIVITENPKGPNDYEIVRAQKTSSEKVCPFCVGNEKMTPPEIYAHREGAGLPNSPGWSVRIVPNKFPALRIEGTINRMGIGLYDMMNGIGAHEVIIENPGHSKSFTDLMDHECEKVIWSYRDRSLDLGGDKRFKYILIFKNYGESAGASLEHSHSQLIALPIVPKRVMEELKWAELYYSYRERCVFCDIIREEIDNAERIVVENKNFVAFTPFVSRFPFEVCIMPKNHSANFSHILKDEVVGLARILKDVLLRMKLLLNDPPYNFLIHTSPVEDKERDDYHWHIELMPRLMKVAGFEWGSGFYINTTPPELAAKYLNQVKI